MLIVLGLIIGYCAIGLIFATFFVKRTHVNTIVEYREMLVRQGNEACRFASLQQVRYAMVIMFTLQWLPLLLSGKLKFGRKDRAKIKND